MKEKNLSLEFLKFLAVLFVANSHMGVLYVKYSALATGGAIGDCLFFFASGFTLFLGRFGRFDNWYKRRIKRIYPSIIVWAFIISFLGIGQWPVYMIVVGGWFWFIRCIMLYYAVLYFIRKWLYNKPVIAFAIVGAIVLIWYLFEDSSVLFMYGRTYFKWMHYFLFILAGAYLGGNVWQLKTSPLRDAIMLVLSIFFFYGIQFLAGKGEWLAHLQVTSLLPLMGIIIFTYKLCCCEKAKGFMNTPMGFVLRFIAGLCLEAYIVQGVIINHMDGLLTNVFPLNLVITFIIIIVAAYIVRCLARVFSQLFEKEDFDWKAVVRLVD